MNRTSKARGVLAVAAAALVVMVGAWSYQACAVYDSSLLLPLDPDASDGGLPAADSGAQVCLHVQPPPRPDASDTDGGIQVIAAFKTIDIGQAADASAPRPSYGYDLDNVCTCPGPPSCAQKGTPSSWCDDDAGGNTGRDNRSIDLFRGLRGAASTGANQIDDGLQAGQYGLLLVIDGYNAQPNDPRVAVSYYVSNGVNRSSDGGLPRPDFMGSDLWTIDPGSLVGQPDDLVKIQSCARNPQCQAVYYDDQAYVVNNTVVANFSANPIPVGFGDRSYLGGAIMELSDAIIVGELRAVQLPTTGFGYELLGGTIAGRWRTSQLLSTLATIPDTSVDGGFLCGNSKNYQIILKNVACGAADISANRLNDNANPPVSCDAVSVGMRFTAGPAVLGSVLAVPPAPAGCGDGGLAFSDKCP